MKMQRSTLATAAALAMGLGMAGEAAAGVYARSYLEVDDLVIAISENGTTLDEADVVTSFNFDLTNTATLNGAGVITGDSCSGSVGANDCSTATPTLDAPPAIAPGSTVSPANNAFTFQGPGSEQYSYSDSVIYTAELTGDPATNTEQIAESEIQTATGADASAEIQSTTGFSFDFTLDNTGTLELDFTANPELLAAINDATAATALSQANLSTQFRLTKDDGSASVSWAPLGTSENNCIVVDGGITCTENADSENLNSNVAVSTNGSSDLFSGDDTFGAYGITIAGLPSGNYTLALSATTSTNVTRSVQAVPEPGILALFGAALLGLGAARSTRSKRS